MRTMAHKITFYIKPENQAHTLSELILSLSPKSIYIHANDHNHANMLSDLLWQHPKDRFIPNVINQDCPQSVILIGYETPPKRDIIINASSSTLDSVNIEWVISTNPDVLANARIRYKHWQSKGHALTCIQSES